jgi:hypothetical protein
MNPYGLYWSGEGLTPAGDDFLLGVSLVLNNWRFARAAALNAALLPLLDRTTDISRAMLEQGCNHHYSAQLLALATGKARQGRRPSPASPITGTLLVTICWRASSRQRTP